MSSPQQPQRKVVLAFMAHPDDAELQAGGTLIRLAELGWSVHVATCTPGDCGTTSRTPQDISAVRTAEARKAAEMLGGQYHCLDERDGFVCYDKPTLHKAVDLFRQVNPSLVITHAAKDYMMDHEMASLIARAASFIYGTPNASVIPLPRGAGAGWLYYCDPVDGVDPLGHEVHPTTMVDVTAWMDRKAEVLACHASQREWLRAYHGIDEYVEGMKRHAARRGGQSGYRYAEAFVQHRGHAYKGNDILAELLTPPA